MKKISILLALIYSLTTIATAAGRPMLPETPYAQAKQSIGKGKPVFLEVGAESCHSCRIMGKMLYMIKEENPSLPIYFINIKKEREVAAPLKIMMIPTQIIYSKEGEEVYRHIGVLKEEEVSKLLLKYEFNTKKEKENNK